MMESYLVCRIDRWDYSHLQCPSNHICVYFFFSQSEHPFTVQTVEIFFVLLTRSYTFLSDSSESPHCS